MRIQNWSSWTSLTRTTHISVNDFIPNSWHKSHTKLPMHYLEQQGFTGHRCANSTMSTFISLLSGVVHHSSSGTLGCNWIVSKWSWDNEKPYQDIITPCNNLWSLLSVHSHQQVVSVWQKSTHQSLIFLEVHPDSIVWSHHATCKYVSRDVVDAIFQNSVWLPWAVKFIPTCCRHNGTCHVLAFNIPVLWHKYTCHIVVAWLR